MICNKNVCEQEIKLIEKNQVAKKTTSKTEAEGTVVNQNGLKIATKVVAGDKILANNETIYEQQIIKYEVKVTNTTENNMENVKIVGKVPEGMTYVDLDIGGFYDDFYDFIPNTEIKQKEIEVGTLKAGQTETYYYEVQVNDLAETEQEKTITSEVKVYIGENEISTYTLKNVAKQAKIAVKLGGYANREKRNQWAYFIKVSNLTSSELQDVQINLPISNKLQIQSVEVWDEESNYEIKRENNNINVKLNKLPAKNNTSEEKPKYTDQNGEVGNIGIEFDNNEVVIYIIADMVSIEENTDYTWQVNSAATVTLPTGDIYKSNDNIASGKIEAIKIEQSSDKSGETLSIGDEIVYKFVVKNVGKTIEEWGKYTTIDFKDFIPNELEILSVNYNNNKVSMEVEEGERVYKANKENITLSDYEIQLINKNDNTEKPRIELKLNLLEDESLEVTIRAKVKTVYADVDIENRAMVTGEYINTKQSNIIQNSIKGYKAVVDLEDPDDEDKPVDPDNPNPPVEPDKPDVPTEKKYTISGIAWIDENENGQREETEQRLSGVEVLLLDITNNKYLQDDNRKVITKTTNNNGQYSFENVKEGKYYVVFKYNNNDYEVTAYKKPGIAATVNSDAMQRETTVDNQKVYVGITDTIDLTSNKENIDIGLIKNKVFDLKVDNYIQKITVQNSKGTKQYTYNNEKMAKVEIPAKQIVGSILVVEYKIVVTNVGELAGTVNELIDEMPAGLEFKSELNANWYKTIGNSINNTSLSTQEIKPGESIETSIVLTKTLDDTIQTYTNIAKIGISDNIKHIEDKNNENDSDKVDIIISIQTGTVINYIATVIGSVLGLAVLLSIVIILIKKNKIKALKVFCFIFAISIIIPITTTNKHVDGEYIGDVNIHINSYSDHDYSITYNGEEVKSICQSRGAHLCPLCNHSMDLTSIVVQGPHNHRIEGGNPELKKESTGIINYKQVDYTSKDNNGNDITESRDIYGPFRVSWVNGSISSVEVKGITNIETAEIEAVNYKIVDATGKNEINITSGSDFYISVPTNVKALTEVAVTAKSTVTVYYTVTVHYYIHLTPNPSPEHLAELNGRTIQEHEVDLGERDREETDQGEASERVNWTTELPKTIRVIKVDYDNREKVLPGIVFLIKNESLGKYVKQNSADLSISYVDNEEDATRFITDAQGIIEVKGLRAGEYTLIEKENPYHGYDHIKNVNADRKITIADTNSLIKYTAKNKEMVGNINIEKVNSENSAIKLNDVEFALLDYTGTKYVKVQIEGQEGFQKRIVGTSKVTKQEFTDNLEEATIFVTDKDGKINIKNIALDPSDTNIDNDNINKYILRELKNPHYGYEVDPDYITWKVDGVASQIRNSQLEFNIATRGGKVDIIVANEQKYVRISGYVYEDVPNGKENVRNELYDTDAQSKDKLVEGIKVVLNNTKTNETYENWTDSKGAYLFGSKNQDGTYSADNILLRDIDSYYVEFIYNGMKYSNVIANADKENGSKAIEGTNRAPFNDKYATITGNIAKGNTGETTGNALNANGNITSDIKYTQPEEHTSQVTYTEGQEYANRDKGIKLNDYYALDKYHISATTQQLGYALKTTYVADNEEIKNINLGIFQREQVDLAISSDIEEVNVSLNGYTNTYNYATRNQYVKNKGAFRTGVKFGDKYLNRYSRTVYQSAVTYFAEDRDNHKLEVNVLYKVTLYNNSPSLVSIFKQINNYYDKEYTPQEVYYMSNGTRTPITTWSIGNETFVNGRLKVLQVELPDTYLAAGETAEVYIRYRVSDEAVLGLMNQEATLQNMTEIDTYSTFTKISDTSYAHYASIDENSAPGNVVPELDADDRFVKTTFEDDTDMAPSLKLQADKNNIISGTVFEDSQTQESKNKNERLGNGIYEQNENVVVNAKVELLEAYDSNDNVDDSQIGQIKYDSDGNPIIAKLYQFRLKEDGTTEGILVDAVTYTDDNGNYQLIGLIPDGYVVRYTYGEGTKIKENGTYKDIDARDYKSTIIASDEIRKALNIQADSATIEGRGNLYWNTIQEKDGNENIIRYSDAVDEILERIKQEQEDDAINYSTLQTKPKDMKARTAAFIVGVEFENINSASNVYFRDTNGDIVIDEATGEPKVDPNFYSENKNMDFGIIYRPLVDIKLDKNLTNMSIQLGNGQILVNGNPYEQDLPYTRAIGDSIYVDMDADLIQGAALKMAYEVKLINASEVDYKYTTFDAKGTAGRRYYYFGDSTGAEKIDKYVKLVGDYLDEELVYDINEMNQGLSKGWTTTTAQKLYEEGRISQEVRDALISGKESVFTTEEFNEGLGTSSNPNIAISKTVRYQVSKLLGAKDELVFTNDAEILELYAVARRSILDTTPGNLIPQYAKEQDEDSVVLTIMPPTGGINYTPYIITVICSLTLVIIGVVLIRRKILRTNK
jgi:uncharacterized repeat protein (TIGR01451 family)